VRRGVAALAAVFALAPAAAASGAAVVAPAVTIDGPSSAVIGLGGVALAPDGGGAVVYGKVAGGAAHVFASVETAGAWAPPVQLDGGLAGPASAPRIAAGSGGRLAAVWVSGGTLYAAVRAAGATAFGSPQAIAPASGVPALGMGASGTAYVAFESAAANEVDLARLDRSSTQFTLLAPLSAPAVALAGAPVIAVAADATAIAAWTQTMGDGSTHVFERRASAAGPSPVLNDLTALLPSLSGVAGGSADSPQVGVAYDSSNGQVAFRETFGGISRVVVVQVLGDEQRVSTAAFADSLGLAPGGSSAAAPSLALNGNAQGLLASELSPSLGLVVAARGTAASPFAWTAGSAINAVANSVAPSPIAALSADGRGVVVYSPSAGNLAAELFAGGVPTGPYPVADAAAGPVAAAGLDAQGDASGDLVIGFVAGAAGSYAVAVDPVVAAPGAPRATGTQLWTADSHPTLAWQPSSEHWAPVSYAVSVDGRQIATTTRTSYAVPPLADGRHSWQVVAHDPYGQAAPSAVRRLLIDAAPPPVALAIAGHHKHHSPLTFTITTTAVSGIRSVALDFGDGSSAAAATATHVYAKAGRYTVAVTVTDRAGVSGTLHEQLRVR
jgi:hypothetical protein